MVCNCLPSLMPDRAHSKHLEVLNRMPFLGIGVIERVEQTCSLDRVLPDLNRPTKPMLERAMQGHVLAEAVLVGTYQKGR